MLSALKSTLRNSPLFGQNPLLRRWRAFGERQPLLSSSIVFVVAWTFLNLMMNLQFPRPEPPLWYVLPSSDVAVLLAAYALVGLLATCGAQRLPWLARLRVPWPVHLLVALLLLGVRAFRMGDGVARVYQTRPGNLFLDAEMLPEIARLLHSTLPLWNFALIVGGIGVALPLLVWLSYRASKAAAKFLAQPKRSLVFWAVTGVQLLVSPLTPKHADPDRYLGAFAASVVPQVDKDFDDFLEARQLRESRQPRMKAARERLEQSSGDLALLGGANVQLFIVESYGVVMLEDDDYKKRLNPFLDSFAQSLKKEGFYAASRVLDSPTIGGYSWLAHVTMATGIRVANQGEFKYVYRSRPKTLVNYFADAGYRTVTAEPATKRAYPGKDFYGFTLRFHNKHLHYKGPKFSWSPMPDQYVIDFVHRRAVAPYKKPQFIKYHLGSSHVPWNEQPPLIADWSKIGDGSIYNELSPIRYPTSWTDLTGATDAYSRSIHYVLDVIQRYTTEFIHDDTLVIIVGDHQPTGQVTHNSREQGVPIHVISKNLAIVQKFIDRGYVPGLHPELAAPRPGMETFPGDFLEDFSTPR